MPKQANREELLKRWSEMAPEECAIEPPRKGYTEEPVLRVNEGGSWYIADSRMLRAFLLSALIEAVRARGWAFALEGETDTPVPYMAYVVINTVGGERREDGEAAEPCDALLAAYVSALEEHAKAS